MPYVLKPSKIFVKNPEGTGFLPQNVIADETAQDIISQVEGAADSIIEEAQQRIAASQDAVDEVETRARQVISDSHNAVDSIEDQKDAMIASIASIAGQGTDTTLTQSGAAADAKAAGDAIDDLKSAVNRSIELGGNNIIALTDFIDLSSTTVSIDDTDNSIMVATTSSGTYRCAQTTNQFISNKLSVGKRYRLHAKAETVSGSPSIRVAVRGVEGNADGISLSMVLTNGGEDFLDFVVDKYMKRITLLVTFSTKASASVKFSEIWLKENDSAVTEIRESYDYFNYKTNEALNLVDYGYGNKKTVLEADPSSPGSGTAVGIERYGTRIKLNYLGDAASGQNKRIAISGTVVRTSGNSTFLTWPGSIRFETGVKYRFRIKKLSGICTVDGAAYIPAVMVFLPNDSTNLCALEESTEDYKTDVFTAPDSLVTVALYLPYNAVTTDLAIDVTLEKVVAQHDIQAYYIDEMDDTIAKARDLSTSPALVFLTAADIHRYSNNAGGVQNFTEMIENMKEFAANFKTDFILNLGDLTDGNYDQYTTLARGYACTKFFHSIGIPYFFVNGNHDTNYRNQAYLFTMAENYKAYYSDQPDDVVFNAAENGTDYYADYNGLGIRFIVLNANNRNQVIEYGYGLSTADWLAEALNTTKLVLLAMHQSPIRDQVYNRQNTTNSASVIEAIQDFVDGGGKIIMMSGHSHCDVTFVDPWLSIAQVCQRFTPDLTEDVVYGPDEENPHNISGFIDTLVFPGRVDGTYTKDAWNVNILKPFDGEINIIRFGAGYDRHIHYEYIAPATLTTRLTDTVTWASSDNAVATVSNGVVTGVAAGKCAVIAKDAEGNIEVWMIKVTA